MGKNGFEPNNTTNPRDYKNPLRRKPQGMVMCGEFAGAPIFEVGFGIPKEPGGGDDFFAHRRRQFRHVAGTFFHGGIRKFGHLDFDERGDFHSVEIGVRIEYDLRSRSAVEAEQVGDAVFDVAGGFGESQSREEP